MQLNPLTTESVAGPQLGQSQTASKSVAPQPAQDSARGTPIPGDQVYLSGSLDKKYQEFQLKNDRSNAAAGAIMKTDRSLEALGQKIEAMKAPLEIIVKNFPPFTAQDKARMKLLMAYSSLRKEIDQLTIPIPPDVVKARKALELPSPLPLNASDGQIADHITKLDATGVALNGMRDGLAADTATLLHDGRFSSIFSPQNSAGTTQSEVPLTESGAAQKSAQVGRQFADTVSQGVTANNSQFLKELR